MLLCSSEGGGLGNTNSAKAKGDGGKGTATKKRHDNSQESQHDLCLVNLFLTN